MYNCTSIMHIYFIWCGSSIDCQNLTISNYWPIAAPKYNSFGYNIIRWYFFLCKCTERCTMYSIIGLKIAISYLLSLIYIWFYVKALAYKVSLML